MNAAEPGNLGGCTLSPERLCNQTSEPLEKTGLRIFGVGAALGSKVA